MKNVALYPFTPNGSITAPPSKTTAHRLIISAGLKNGKTKIYGVGNSDDVNATISCLQSLGAKIEREKDYITVEGIKKVNSVCELDAGESGSTLRFLMPVVCALGVNAKFLGRGELLKRPNKPLIDLLSSHGIHEKDYSFSGKLSSGKYIIDASISSQYVSGLLFALPLLNGNSTLKLKGKTVSKNYILSTLKVLNLSGIKYKKIFRKFIIKGNQNYLPPDEVFVDGDFSGASAILAIGAIGGKATVKGLDFNSVQPDRAIVETLKKIGCKTEITKSGITTYKRELKPFKVSVENTPDLAPVLCSLATYTGGKCEISGVERLKYKESDRIKAILDMLSSVGVKCEYKDKKIVVYGGVVKGGKINSYNDHRIVMASTVLSVKVQDKIEIVGADAVKKSYPEFFEDIKKLGGKIDVDMDRR